MRLVEGQKASYSVRFKIRHAAPFFYCVAFFLLRQEALEIFPICIIETGSLNSRFHAFGGPCV